LTPTERILAALASLDAAGLELAAKFCEALARKRTERRLARARVHHHRPQAGGDDAA